MSVVDAANLSDAEIIGRLAVSLAVGGALGLERELDGKEAGMRTHALLALGAAVFGVVSVAAFGTFASDASSNVTVDVTRIASYVAAGVGFLAGGAIVRDETRVKGLTTAASLWVCAGVGLAAGLGFYVGAIAGTALALVMLLLDRPLARLRLGRRHVTLLVSVRDSGVLSQLVTSLLDSSDPKFHPRLAFNRQPDGGIDVDIVEVRLPQARRLLAELSVMPGVDKASLLGD